MRRPLLLLGGALLGAAGLASAQETPQTGAPAEWVMPMLEPQIVTFVEAERLEGRASETETGYLFDLQGWVGTDASKVWLKLEGEGEVGGKLEALEVQALYSRMIGAFFDLQLGVRQDTPTAHTDGHAHVHVTEDGPRTHAVVGIQGLAPYWFELDAAAFVSHTGDVTARVEVEYELLFTQRLVLQPRMALHAAFQDVEARGLGAGLSSAEAGLRLRYEIRREVAPYVGLAWRQAFGGTADAARAAGAHVAGTSLVAGLRLWY